MLRLLALWIIVLWTCSATINKEIPELSLNSIIQTGIKLEQSDEPDSALRAFRTALRLLNEEIMTDSAYKEIENLIHSWMHTTKTRRLGAFKPTSTTIKLPDGSSKRVQWTLGDDLRQMAEDACYQDLTINSDDDECQDFIFKQLVEAEELYRPPARNGVRPPRYIPEDLWENYTRGYSQVIYMYRDDSQPGYYQEWTKRELDDFANMVRLRQDGTNYPEVDRLLYKLLDGSSGPVHRVLHNQSVAIIGSAAPWYEVLALQFGARETVTIEYNRLHYAHPRMRTLTPGEFWVSSPAAASSHNPSAAANLPQPREQFGLALSISSFEHDGLGRYGDPLAPDGDMAAMRQMESVLIPGGILILAVPVAADSIVWNCHRVYGRRRLTSLVERWTVRRVLGLTEDMFETIKRFPSQPVFVLENTRPARPLDFDSDDWASAVSAA